MIKISVITICLNNLNGLKKTVESVKMQSYPNIEHVIIDGNSTDGTKEYLSKVRECSNTIIISEPDEGRSDAFNKGIMKSSGELLIFLNSGDCFVSENVVETAAEEWEKAPVDVLGFEVETDLGAIMYADESTWHTGLFAHQGLFIRRSVFDRCGMYNKYLINRMDYDLFLRMVKEDCSHRFIPVIIAKFDTGGITSTNRHNAILEGLGLELIYNKHVTADNMNIIRSLYEEEGKNGKNVIPKSIDGNYTMLKKWLNWIFEGGSVDKELKSLGYQKVAIYGMGIMGNLLYKSLADSSIEILFGIDRNERTKISGCDIYSPEKIPSCPDAIIISNSTGIEDIKNNIRKHASCPLVSLQEIIDK